jgi:hypothetical protein
MPTTYQLDLLDADREQHAREFRERTRDMLTFRLLVTGWRGWPEGDARYVTDAVREALDPYRLPLVSRRIVVHGACPTGVDAIVDRWLRDRPILGVELERHPANWSRNGRAAGPIRNTEMVNLGADMCLAFPGPVEPGAKHRFGTRDCLGKAIDAGIPCRVSPYGWWNGPKVKTEPTDAIDRTTNRKDVAA